MTGNDIKSDVQAKLADTGIQWIDANLLLWVNEGGRDIAMHKPKAATVRENILLTAGVTKQANPANVIQVLDLTVNMGVSGTMPGRGISAVTEERLRAVKPSWRSDRGDAVRHLVNDDRDPGFFIVWPALRVAGYVEALVQKQFTPIAALTETLSLDNSYRNPLADYVMHCAYAMEGDQLNMGLSAAYYAKYAQAMGIKVQREKRASSPANSPENPAHPVVDKNGA